MNTPENEAVKEGPGRTKLAIAGVALIAAFVLVVVAILSGSGDDEPSADAADDDIQATANDESTDDPVGLGELCADIRHQPVEGQDSASGIWVRGEVYGLSEGWILVEGPTINNGERVQIPVDGNRFEAGLGINSYGDHEIESFRISGEDTDEVLQDATDLLDVFDGIISVDADEGSPFDTECFQFDPPIE